MKNITKITFVILATLIGAGFASGKEIYSFFFIYGKNGIIGIIISSIIISLVIYKVLKICNTYSIKTYNQFCVFLNNRLLNNIVNIFLLISFYIMVSGFSSFLYQEFNINRFLGGIIIAFLSYCIFQKNISGIVKLSNCFIPIIIFFIIIISLRNIDFIDKYNYIFDNLIICNNPLYIAVFKSILYASYNCIILIPVIIPLSEKLKKCKEYITTALLSGVLLIILSFSIYNILLQGNKEIFEMEMPILGIVRNYGKLLKEIYIIIIGSAIFTTAISTGFGFLNNCSKDKKQIRRNALIICVTAILFSKMSFSSMINLIYPILGIIGIIEIIYLIYLSFYEENY